MKRPDIVFIFMDDMGWRDLACTGSGFYETPNIDRLCQNGMRFPSAYAACPVCSPSRASYLTGMYPARVGVTDWIDGEGVMHPLKGKLIDAPYAKHLPDKARTIAHALREGGYRTWHVGKWHLGGEGHLPEDVGFEINIGGCEWGHPRYGYFSPYKIPNLPEGPEGEYLNDRMTDEAIKLIQIAGEGPFFLSLCHYAVHNPIQAKKADVARFREKARALHIDEIPALVEGERHPVYDGHVRRRIIQSDPAYAAMIYNLDFNIGRLVDALAKAGRLENTLIVFTSDNGGLATTEGSPTCNAPAREGKGWVYEGGTRVPLLAHWPGKITPGSVCETPVTTPDFYPTFLAAAGLAPDARREIDGVNILPLMTGGTIPTRPIFWHYPHYGNQGGTPASSVRLGNYLLIELFETGKVELYDVEEDIAQARDLSAVLPTVAKKLHDILRVWRDDVCAKYPTPNPDYKP